MPNRILKRTQFERTDTSSWSKCFQPIYWQPRTRINTCQFPRNQDVNFVTHGRVTVTNPCEVFRNFRVISLESLTCETTIKMLRMNANLVSAARARHSEVSDACSLSSVWPSTSCVRFLLSTNDQLKAALRHQQHGLATSPTVVTLKKIRPSRQDHWKAELNHSGVAEQNRRGVCSQALE